MPKISVIIPVYNSEKYIEQCLQSILGQTLDDLEVICIDDGSADRSLEILSAYGKGDKRVICFTQQNQGAGMARNRGIREAGGEYLMFVDSDDYLLERDLLEQMYMACQKYEVAICGALRKFDRKGELTCSDLHRQTTADSEDGKRVRYSDYQYDFHFQSYMYSRKLLTENGIWFPDYRRYEDPVFFVKAMVAAREFYVIPKEGYCYRIGHKRDFFSERAVTDMVKGVMDNLRISGAYGLRELHELMVSRIEESFYHVIMQQIGKGNILLLKELWMANETVKWEWLGGRGKTLLKPLQFTLDAACIVWGQYEKYIGNNCREQVGNGWIFPFSQVPLNSKVILYAAGSMGRCYAEQLKETAGYEFVLWVDRNYQECTGVQVFPVEKILETEYDYIVIAIEDAKIAKEITGNLVNMGIDENKIIWKLNVDAKDISLLSHGMRGSI